MSFLFPSVVNGTDLLADLFVVMKEDSPLIFRAIAFSLVLLIFAQFKYSSSSWRYKNDRYQEFPDSFLLSGTSRLEIGKTIIHNDDRTTFRANVSEKILLYSSYNRYQESLFVARTTNHFYVVIREYAY